MFSKLGFLCSGSLANYSLDYLTSDFVFNTALITIASGLSVSCPITCNSESLKQARKERATCFALYDNWWSFHFKCFSYVKATGMYCIWIGRGQLHGWITDRYFKFVLFVDTARKSSSSLKKLWQLLILWIQNWYFMASLQTWMGFAFHKTDTFDIVMN